MDTYEKKLALAKEALDSGSYDKETIEYIFPELAESDDERIRRSITEFFKNYSEKGTWKAIPDVTKWIAWLEAQGTPAKLSEEERKVIEYISPELKESEDERIRKWIKNELESKYVVDNIVNNVMADKALAYLEKQGKQKSINEDFEASLKHVMEEAIECGDTHNLNADADMLLRLAQKPTEWSEEDESYLSNAIMYVSCTTHHGRIKKYKVIEWLKSLKDRYTWKPSDEQMTVFKMVFDWYNRNFPKFKALDSLYNDLNKLKEIKL